MKFLNIFVVACTFMLASTTVTFAQSTNEKVQTADTTKTLTIKVKGITCSVDLKSISANVEKLQGVSTCKARKTGPTSTFEVTYNPTLTSEKEIHTAIQNTAGCKDPDERPYKIKQ